MATSSRSGWAGAAVAIGNFDGVHVGHRALIAARARARRGARRGGGRADVRSASVGAARAAAAAGEADVARAPARAARRGGRSTRCVVEPFTRELAGLAPHAFIDDVVINALRARAIIVGYDFSYGAGRAGIDRGAARPRRPRRASRSRSSTAVEVGGEVASSTKIRGYLRDGRPRRGRAAARAAAGTSMAWWSTAPSAGARSACRPRTSRPTASCRWRRASTP